MEREKFILTGIRTEVQTRDL